MRRGWGGGEQCAWQARHDCLWRRDQVLVSGIQGMGINSERRGLVREHHQPGVQDDLGSAGISTITKKRAMTTHWEENVAGTDETEKTSNSCQPTRARTPRNGTHTRGNMTAQPSPVICHSIGRSGVETMMTPIMMTVDMHSGNQNLFAIFGISLKKFDRSTSLFVAPHEMLYENRCARIAWLSGIERPPKKKKLRRRETGRDQHGGGGAKTQRAYKNGTHFRFSKSAQMRSFSPRRYSSSVKPRLPDP